MDDNHANLKVQTRKLIRQGQRPVFPSTHVIGKRKPKIAFKLNLGWPNANDNNNDQTEPFEIDSKTVEKFNLICEYDSHETGIDSDCPLDINGVYSNNLILNELNTLPTMDKPNNTLRANDETSISYETSIPSIKTSNRFDKLICRIGISQCLKLKQ